MRLHPYHSSPRTQGLTPALAHDCRAGTAYAAVPDDPRCRTNPAVGHPSIEHARAAGRTASTSRRGPGVGHTRLALPAPGRQPADHAAPPVPSARAPNPRRSERGPSRPAPGARRPPRHVPDDLRPPDTAGRAGCCARKARRGPGASGLAAAGVRAGHARDACRVGQAEQKARRSPGGTRVPPRLRRVPATRPAPATSRR